MIFSAAENHTEQPDGVCGLTHPSITPGCGDSFFSRPTVLSLVGNTTRTNGWNSLPGILGKLKVSRPLGAAGLILEYEKN
jgi:hypothetical protein